MGTFRNLLGRDICAEGGEIEAFSRQKRRNSMQFRFLGTKNRPASPRLTARSTEWFLPYKTQQFYRFSVDQWSFS